MAQLRTMIGQMLVMGFSGYEIDKQSSIVSWLEKDGLGGVLLFDYDLPKKQFGKNLYNKTQIKQLNKKLSDYALSKANEDKLPLLIGLDYEGGDIDRLSHIAGCMKTKTPFMQAALSAHAMEHEFNQMAITLKELGFNLNFAPVVDLNLNKTAGIIGRRERSFAANPTDVARVASQFVKVFNRHGIACCYKHFPGHGSALGDTHEGFVDVTDTFKSEELLPYKLLVEQPDAQAMIMTAHVVNNHLDNSGNPATLSYPVLTSLLRQTLGFEGVIISDDLQMHAIANHYSIEQALMLTINAGADMLIFGNQLGEITATEVIDQIERLVKNGDIHQMRIEQAYQRICQFKTVREPSTSLYTM